VDQDNCCGVRCDSDYFIGAIRLDGSRLAVSALCIAIVVARR
jgi:hypothetical protein